MTNIIVETLRKYISDQTVRFVFATQVECERWADMALEVTDAEAVATERFIAWDDFKGTAVKCRNESKESIPSLLRSVFAASIIEENAREKFIRNIISPEYADSAQGFQDWIEGLLPSLKSWKEHYDSYIEKGFKTDAEDQDYLELYNRYLRFLDDNNLFDPAWERPPFVSDGNTYVIFYPESLMDWADYMELLESATDTIKLIHLPEDCCETASVDYYENTRVELTQAALFARKMHVEKNIPWTDIAISVPDLESYEPYLLRELERYEIPVNARRGSNLGETRAGRLFSQIAECHSSNFSYESVKNLFMNSALPWGEASSAIDSLLNFGRENNCLYSYSYDGQFHDIWEESFRNPKNKENPVDEKARNIYRALKKTCTAICVSETFEDVKKSYNDFKSIFFKMDEFEEESNKIVARCVKSLDSLIDLEKKFQKAKVKSPFKFFVNVISKIVYVSQNKNPGLHIYQYRLAACAPFRCHIVIDASQDSLSVEKIYKRLGFLSDSKRKNFGIDDIDPTVTFIRMYASSSDEIFFSASEKTLDGYSFPHGFFKWNEMRPKELEKSTGKKPELLYDMYKEEENFINPQDKTEQRYVHGMAFVSGTDEENYDVSIYEGMKKSQDEWMEKVSGKTMDDTAPDYEKLITEKLYSSDGKLIKVSESALKNFFVCPRLFFLNYVLGIRQLSDETELTDIYFEGNLKHEIMERYFGSLKDENKVIAGDSTLIPPEYEKILFKAIDDSICHHEASFISRELLKTRIEKLKEDIYAAICIFSDFFSGYEVYSVEEWLTSPADSKAESPEFKFTGRTDCILKKPETNNESEEYIIIDFKSGNIPSHPLCEQKDEMEDYQMPLYVNFLKNSCGMNVTGFAYYSFKDSKLVCGWGTIKNLVSDQIISPVLRKGSPLTVSQAEALTMETFNAKVEEYVEAVKKRDFHLAKHDSSYMVCKSCRDFRAVCRKYFTVSGRE